MLVILCVFYVNSSHSVCECYGEKIIATYVPIFVNAGNFVNVLEKELLQTKYCLILKLKKLFYLIQ
jgi:hypothetical protein